MNHITCEDFFAMLPKTVPAEEKAKSKKPVQSEYG